MHINGSTAAPYKNYMSYICILGGLKLGNLQGCYQEHSKPMIVW